MKSLNQFQTLANIFGRFSLVGILSTVIYFSFANFFIWSNIATPIIASSLAFLITIPISFYGHGNFTFQVRKHYHNHLKRYILYIIFGFVTSNAVMFVTSLIDYLNAYMGVAIVTMLLPILNFTILKFFVFSQND